jgi:outer membrane receptor for ferrienterochelin and colicin
MKLVCRVAAMASVAVVLAAAPLVAGQESQSVAAEQPAAQQPKAQQPTTPPTTPPPAQQPTNPPDEPQKYEETVVVSASRTEEKLANAPATMSVITASTIQQATSQNFAELLRTIPGLNLTQVSARDINVTSRAATGTLATGLLALLDGRSLYQDMFGFVMWDFLPVNLNEIKQIEVIRGPASAVWGANALYGVVNVISKSPREMQGTSATFGIGAFARANGEDSASLWYISGTHAQAVNDRWSYKLSAGGYSQDPFSRPTGTIPCDRPAVCTVPTTTYPPYTNTGTTQPKFDARVDYDYPDGAKLSVTGGVAGTDGIMHTGIGPFDIQSGTVMGYGKVAYSNKALRASFFTNILHGDADNLLARNPLTGNPITFAFDTKTYDFEVSNVTPVGKRHAINYGGNLRFNAYDLEIAPLADNRTEFGVYAQDEMFLSDHFRLNLGARVDRFDYLHDVVFSPRSALLINPRDNQTILLSYNRAYRAPSVINNWLSTVIARPVDLRALGGPATYALPVNIVGNTDLTEQSLDAYEIGYTGMLPNRAVVSAAFYVNNVKEEILFTEDASGRYTAANPPANWPLPPAFINFIYAAGRTLPGRFTYENFGRSVQKGLELGVDTPVNHYVNAFVNYTYQATPDPKDFDLSELNLPPKNRFNVGVSFNYQRYLGNFSVAYTDDAFWQDVLDAPYHGTTKAYTLVNAGFGVRWGPTDRITTSIKAVNLANQNVQQHVFGDITKRQVVGEFRVQF